MIYGCYKDDVQGNMEDGVSIKKQRISSAKALGMKALLMSSVCLGGGGLAPVVAQSSAESDVDTVFEEIVVTASRREQSLKDVPASVAAISPDDFKFKGMQQIRDILDYTPGVKFNDQGGIGQGSITARGVPQSSSTPVFGVYLDDVPLSTNTNFAGGGSVFFDGLLIDVERVEVIKGPQGTLYGATSVGGMMRYISRAPQLDGYRASVGADISHTYSGELGQSYNARLSGAIVEDKLGITVSGFYREAGGYVDHVSRTDGSLIQEDIDGGDVKGFAADLLFRPSDALEIKLKYLRQDASASVNSGVNLAGVGTDAAIWGGYSTITPPGSLYLDYEILSGSLQYDFGSMVLNATSSYVKYDFGNVVDRTVSFAGLTDFLSGRPPGTTTGVHNIQEAGSEKFVQEVRLTSAGDSSLEWIAGLYFADENSFNNQSLQALPALNLLTIEYPSDYKEYAAFGDVTYYFNDKFDVTAGIRISKNEIVLAYNTSGPALGDADIVTDPVKDTIGTYLLAARYRPFENLSLYTRVASGYRPAQSNIPVLNPETGENVAPAMVEADSAWSYEIGAKGNTDDRRFSYNLAFWMIAWANFQANTVFNGVNTGGNAQDGLSAHGFEIETVMRFIDDLSVSANLSHTISELNSDEPGFGGLEGEQHPNLPKWSGSVQWDYRFDVSENWTASLGGGVRYSSSFVSSFGASTTRVPVVVDSQILTDLNVNVSNESVSFGLYVTNLFNERVLAKRDDNILVGTGVVSTGVFKKPRTVGANIRFNF